MWRSLLRILALVMLALLAFSTFMLFNETDYLFFPNRHVERTPHAIGLPFRTVSIASTNGVKLQGWFIPANQAKAVVLHLHGNAGNIGDRLSLYMRWHRMGLAVLAFDYRGYGNSSGIPSETGFYADAEAAWHHLTASRGIAPKRILIAGRSIGAAVAAHLAASHPNAAGLALETPFSSTAAMAEHHYPFFLLRPLIRNRFDTVMHVRKVRVPLLIITARDDTITPPFMGAAILAAAQPLKQRVTLTGDHNDFDRKSETEYLTAWRNWLAAKVGLSGRLP